MDYLKHPLCSESQPSTKKPHSGAGLCHREQHQAEPQPCSTQILISCLNPAGTAPFGADHNSHLVAPDNLGQFRDHHVPSAPIPHCLQGSLCQHLALLAPNIVLGVRQQHPHMGAAQAPPRTGVQPGSARCLRDQNRPSCPSQSRSSAARSPVPPQKAAPLRPGCCEQQGGYPESPLDVGGLAATD